MNMSFDPRMPSPDTCVLRDVLERRAKETPESCFVTFEDGTSWSYAQLLGHTRRAAASLQHLGVCQDDRVLLWMANGPDALRLWFAINYIGAVFVPINPVHRGNLLEHMINNSQARLMLAHASLVSYLESLKLEWLSDLVIFGGDTQKVKDLQVFPAKIMQDHGSEPTNPIRPIMPWDLQQVIYTSGTTGPSKGVLCSYLKAKVAEPAFDFLTSNDRYLVNLPFFHVSGAAVVMDMLRRGASVALVGSFSASNFWAVARQTKATCCTLIGSMAQLLLNSNATIEDRQHQLRAVIMLPLVPEPKKFTDRFGCDIYTVFSMTEVASPIVSTKNPSVSASCGKARVGVELRIVDANDCEVTIGNVGELIVRSDIPWAISHGYLNAPEATAQAWRNGWFHTGDAFRCDQDGNYFFVDRMKDTIRRRGENISSFEVEVEVSAHPLVREVAAYAVTDSLGGDEVMVAICLKEGATLEWSDLLFFLSSRMAIFMVPRYLRLVQELPKTPTQKVQKLVLRSEGVTEDTFDRVTAGLQLGMEPHHVKAFNVSAKLENKIHHDDVAIAYGFSGALVPGTAVFGYMVHQPVSLWGRKWLESGSAKCRFDHPVYEGRSVHISAIHQSGRMQIQAHSDQLLCAVGSAEIEMADRVVASMDTHPYQLPPFEQSRPIADVQSLAPGVVLCTQPYLLNHQQAQQWLIDLQETDSIYMDEGLLHPATLLRLSNWALMQNVSLGPWIHTASHIQNFNAMPIGASLEARAVVLRNWNNKGHQMVELDVLVVIDGKTPAARINHCAIYETRPPKPR